VASLDAMDGVAAAEAAVWVVPSAVMGRGVALVNLEAVEVTGTEEGLRLGTDLVRRSEGPLAGS